MTEKSKYSAGILFYCPEDQTMFMVKRSKIMNNPKKWDLPGGRNNESDKNEMETAIREAGEEIGKLPNDRTYLGKHIIVKNHDYQYHCFVFAIPLKEKENWKPELDEENKEDGWFRFANLPEDLNLDMSWVPSVTKKAHRRSHIQKIASIIAPRFELKYFVSPQEANEIKDFIKPYTTADEHGQFYNIKNIYLDNNDLKFYTDHLLSPDRIKLRIRFYDNDDKAFFEIKKRANGNITKYRYVSDSNNLEEIIEKNEIPFAKIANKIHAHPIMLINYDREAYQSPENGRITFDSNIRYAQTNAYDRDQIPQNVLLPEDINILELKFNGEMPEFIKELIAVYDLERVPMSKYVTAISESISTIR